jgi:hypothetical protein
MPNYFKSSITTTTSSLNLIDNAGIFSDPFLQPNTGTGTGTGTGAGSGCCVCPSQTNFLSTLADKLKDMVQSLQVQFEELRNKVAVRGEGAVLAGIASSAKVDVQVQYVIYVQRYGPPVNGVFDAELLDEIIREYNIPIL